MVLMRLSHILPISDVSWSLDWRTAVACHYGCVPFTHQYPFGRVGSQNAPDRNSSLQAGCMGTLNDLYKWVKAGFPRREQKPLAALRWACLEQTPSPAITKTNTSTGSK